jgi:beta-phosphoglucomutase-like phosphatase (HAD superfamily)
VTPAALVLGFDGTIVDTVSAVHRACAAEYARFGMTLDPATMAGIVGGDRWGPRAPAGRVGRPDRSGSS